MTRDQHLNRFDYLHFMLIYNDLRKILKDLKAFFRFQSKRGLIIFLSPIFDRFFAENFALI